MFYIPCYKLAILVFRYSVVNFCYYFSAQALEWDGLEGSFGIFGLRASHV
jgi:hypothetical protein